jgi:hypothetical protein
MAKRSFGAGSAAVARLGAECFAQVFGPRFLGAITDRAQESKSKT